MKLAETTKKLVLGNIELIRFCMNNNLDINKLSNCSIEKMKHDYYLCLPKEGVQGLNKAGVLLEKDTETQPDVVLIISLDDVDNIKFETTEFTKRISSIQELSFRQEAYTAQQLSALTTEELGEIYKSIEEPTQEQKERAWKRMDIGIYDEAGNLIGDKQMHEDGYDELEESNLQARQEIIDKVVKVCKEYRSLLKRVTLIGPTAIGEITEDSDIDLYIEPIQSHKVTKDIILSDYYTKFTEDLYSEFKNREFNLFTYSGESDIKALKESLLWGSIRKDGIVIYEQ